jgi:hypothetical protein
VLIVKVLKALFGVSHASSVVLMLAAPRLTADLQAAIPINLFLKLYFTDC